MKPKTEYERKFGISATKFIEDFERENAGLASQQVAASYAAKDPPIQGKKRFSIVGAPAAAASASTTHHRINSRKKAPASASSVAAGVPIKPSSSRDYVILGKSDSRWPDRGGPGAAAPKTAYRLKASSSKVPSQNRIFNVPSEAKERKHHKRCKKTKNVVAKTGESMAAAVEPSLAAAPVSIPEALLPATPAAPAAPAAPAPISVRPIPSTQEALPNTEVNPALRRKAGLPTRGGGAASSLSTSTKGEKLFKTEYSREFIAKSLDSAPLHSPIMTAEKFYKGTIDLAHFPPTDKENAQPRSSLIEPKPLTEHREQFPLLPSSAYSRVLVDNLNTNNNNSNNNANNNNNSADGVDSYDIISHFPRSKAIEDADSVSPSSLEFLSRTSLPVPHLPPKSPVESTYDTEYRSNFKPFNAFKYEDGAFREEASRADESTSPPLEASLPSFPPSSLPPSTLPPNSWFSEVLELREKAAKYKDRFATDRFTEIRKKAELEAGLVVEDVEEQEEEDGNGVAEEMPPLEADVNRDEDDDDDDDDVVTSPKRFVTATSNDDDDDDDVTSPKRGVEALAATGSHSQGELSLDLGNVSDEERVKEPLSAASSVSSVASIDRATKVFPPASAVPSAGRNSRCDCGASVVSSSSSSSSFKAPPPPPPADPRSTYRSSYRGEKKRLKPNFVPPTIKESMAETYTKPVIPGPNGPSISNRPSLTDNDRNPSSTDNERSPSPADSVASSTASEMSSRSLSRAEDILQRAKSRQKQFWGK